MTTEFATSDDALTADEQQVVDRAANWAATTVAPMAETWERERRFASEAFASAAEQRLTGLLVPTADGGEGLSHVGFARVLEEIAAVDFGVAFALVCHNNLSGAVARLALPAMRAARLGQLTSGERLGAFLFTEPGVGSDATEMTATATPDGDGWVLNGTKAWVTNGSHAELLSVYAQTEPGTRNRGIATFLVDASAPGVVRGEPYELVGGHAAGVNDVSFHDCRLEADDLFIDVGRGFGAAMEGIDIARVMVSAMCCGILRQALTVAVAYVRERMAFGGRVADLQGVRFMLADVATDLRAARLLAFRAARLLAEGERVGSAAAHAKKFATRVAEAGVRTCMQVMGAQGARRDHPLPRHLGAVRLTHYVDGATEIQNVVIARELLD